MIGNAKKCIIILFILAGCGTTTEETRKKIDNYMNIVTNYAPFYMQTVKEKYDIPTYFDFDGDIIGNNNWENAEKVEEFTPVAYFDVKETEDLFYLFYGLFYPRDWLPDCKNPPPPENCHENDYEQIMIAVEKSSGKILFFETLPHIFSIVYTFSDTQVITSGVVIKGRKPSAYENHPIIYIEAEGHGQYGNKEDILEKENYDENSVVLLIPENSPKPNMKVKDVKSYKLVYIYDAFWGIKDNIGNGKTFDNIFEVEIEGKIFRLPANFDGDISGEGVFKEDAASAPWYTHSDTADKGIWFLDPAEIAKRRFGKEFSKNYIFNPYIE